MANKWVYIFSEGDMTMRNLLGGKGANLAEMITHGHVAFAKHINPLFCHLFVTSYVNFIFHGVKSP